MRIIDRNTDFYDYLQDVYYDESLTFDRRDSFILTKDEIATRIYSYDYPDYAVGRRLIYCDGISQLIKVQVCNTFWVFGVDLTDCHRKKCDSLTGCIHLLSTWKDYTMPRLLIEVSLIQCLAPTCRLINAYLSKREDEKLQKLLRETLQTKHYCYSHIFNSNTTWVANKEITKHIPILKATGLAQYIDPLDIYLAFEEYFSLEKTDSERTESIGLTNDEKVENHGFDLRTSFRGN